MAKIGGDYFSFASVPTATRTQAPAVAGSQATSKPAEVAVKSGDTLSAIAQRHGVSLEQLKQLNPHLFQDGKDAGGRKRAADGHWVYPGDKVRLRPDSAPTAPLEPVTGTAPLATDTAGSVSATAQQRYGGYAVLGKDSGTGSAGYKSPGVDPAMGSTGYKSPGTDPKTGSAAYKSPGVDPKTGSPNYTPPKPRDGVTAQETAGGTAQVSQASQDRYGGFKSPGTDTATAPATPPKTVDAPAPARSRGDNLEGQRHLLGAVHGQFNMVARYDSKISKEDFKFNVADRPGRQELLRDFDKYASDEGQVKKEDVERWIQDVDRKLGRTPVDFEAKADPAKEKKLVKTLEQYYDKIAGDDDKISKEDIRKNVADDLEGRDALIRHFDKLAPRGYLKKGDLEDLAQKLGEGRTLGQIAAGN